MESDFNEAAALLQKASENLKGEDKTSCEMRAAIGLLIDAAETAKHTRQTRQTGHVVVPLSKARIAKGRKRY